MSQKLTAGLLNIYQTAAVIGVSTSTVHNWTERGYMPAPTLFGGRYRWRFDDLKQWAADGFPHQQPEPKKGTTAKR
jgi:excisionase family DNA binding protein